jgi:uncharacterized protein YjbJ (UPF0337 family)
MNDEHVKGATEKGEGKVKEAVGHLTGNTQLEAEGKVDQVKGTVHSAVGDVKDSAKESTS